MVQIATTFIFIVMFSSFNFGQSTNASSTPQNNAPEKSLHTKTQIRSPYHSRFQWTIDRPVRNVWPVFYDVRRWVHRYRVDMISGSDPMAVGSVSKATPLYGEALKDPEMFYFMKVVSMIPEKSILVWLTLPETKDPEGRFTQFYYWQLVEIEGKTTITIDAFGETPVPSSHEWTGGIQSYGDESWPSYIRNLEKLVMDYKLHSSN